LVLLAGLTQPLHKWADYDLFWHLENGRLLNRGIPLSPDRLSWSMAGKPYFAYSGPVDRLFYEAYRIGGARGLGLLATLGYVFAVLPYLLLLGRLRLRPLAEGAVAGLLVVAVMPFAGARPHLAAAVLAGGIALLLEKPFGVRKALLVGGALGFWANLHGSFYLGFALVGAGLLAWLLVRDFRAVAWVGAALGLGFALSLASPHRLELWTAPLTTANNPLLPVVNQDWVSLQPKSIQVVGASLLLLAATAVGVWQSGRARALGAIGLLLPSIQVARFSLFGAPLLGVATAERAAERWPALQAKRPPKPQAKAWTILAIGFALRAAWLPGLPPTLEAAATRELPVAAVDRLLACAPPGPVWNDFNWGGYLLWRGDGQYPVGIDGRLETLYPTSSLVDYLNVLANREGWSDIINRSPVQYALVGHAAGSHFAELPDWRTAYDDGSAAIVVREGAPWLC
jgi:hypothetical protein